MNRFEDIVNQVKKEQPDDAVVAESGERVRRTLFGAGAAGVTEIHGCDDFRTLMPAYLQKTLSDARRMLLEDHIRTCVACRKALDRERGIEKTIMMPVAARRMPAVPKWAIAAAVLVCVGGGVFASRHSLTAVLDSSPRATVQSVEGMLYRVSNTGSLAAVEGVGLADGQEVRTASGSRAILKLWDGSRVEMNERAELSVSRGWRGTTIQLDRGHIIVQAAKQKQGHLFVATGDSEVSVKGTIFAVNKGTLGSRVSVVEGEVQVSHNGHSEALKPGEQARTSAALESSPVAEEFSWSKDASRYASLLGELAILQKKLEAIPSTGLRYQSRLLVYVPEDTAMFAAIPNVGVMLTEAKQIFDERLRMSEVLRSWWMNSSNKEAREGLDMMLDKLKVLSSYVGDEIIIAVQGNGSPDGVLIFAEAKPGVQDFLERELRNSGAQNHLLFSVRNNVLIVSDKAANVAKGEAIVARGGTTGGMFRSRIEQGYKTGAGWLFAANLEQISTKSVDHKTKASMTDLGFNTAQSIVVERREVGGRTENRATLQFAGERRGIPGMLGNAGPMSTLEFVSPEAGAVASLVVKQPRALVEELLQIAQRGAGQNNAAEKFESATGLRIIEDLAAPLGSEATLALDGPILPVPSWKLAVEVNSPQRLQASLEKMVELFNQEQGGKSVPLTLTKEDAAGRTFYKINSGSMPFEAHWTYVDSYLLMAANRVLLTDAIQKRQMGLNLARSEKFRALLPSGANPNFSGLFYQNFGTVVAPLVETLQTFMNLTPAQKQSLQGVKETQASVIGITAEPDRIVAATTGNFFGLPLGALAGAMPSFVPANSEQPTKLKKHLKAVQ